MITDYSSVSWDFFYLNKPVIFYRFDYNEYKSDRGSYIPLDEPIIGDIAINAEELINNLIKVFQDDLMQGVERSQLRNQLYPFSDRNNCSRIYNELNNFKTNLLITNEFV